MPVTTFQGTVDNGQVRLAADVRLPENAKVFVVVPDFEPNAGSNAFDLADGIANASRLSGK